MYIDVCNIYLISISETFILTLDKVLGVLKRYETENKYIFGFKGNFEIPIKSEFYGKILIYIF